jgi:hypothetical protein
MFFQKVQEGSCFHPGPGDDVCRGVKSLFVEEELFITDSSENKSKEDREEEHGRQECCEAFTLDGNDMMMQQQQQQQQLSQQFSHRKTKTGKSFEW